MARAPASVFRQRLSDDPDTTTVVPPGWSAVLDEWGNLRLERGK